MNRLADLLRAMSTNWYFADMDSAKTLLAAATEIERLAAPVKVFVVTVKSPAEEYHTELDEPRVFRLEADALDWVWKDLPDILSRKHGRKVHLAPTERPYGTQWSVVSYMNGMPYPLGIRVNLTSSILPTGGEA
jgi:hypothetical protein